jgi:amino acid transporter
MVAGGPYGLEELLAGGYATAVVVLLLTPLLWAAPIALMAGELGSAVPEAGGYYAWAKRALGPAWAVWAAWLAILASVVDIALYPTLFGAYLARAFPGMSHAWQLGFGVSMIVVCTVWNLMGSFAVGRGSIAFFVITIAPILVLSVLAVTGRAPGDPTPNANPSAGTIMDGVLVAMWSYSGWDCATTVSGEVRAPERTVPRALALSLALVTLTYLIPVAALSRSGLTIDWRNGALVDIGGMLGGSTLSISLAICGAVSCFGMFNSLVLSYSRLPAVLSNDGYLPKFFDKRTRGSDAPWPAIITCAVAYSTALVLDFRKLLQLDLLFYGACLFIQFASLLALRIREPQLKRPVRLPGGLPGALLILILPTTIVILALVRADREYVGPVGVLWVGVVGIAASGVGSWVVSRSRAAPARESA